MTPCSCCGNNPCAFETQPGSLRIRMYEEHKREKSAKRAREDNQREQEIALLLKLRDGGPGFTSKAHEERRAVLLESRGMLVSKTAVYRSRYDRQGTEIIDYRSRYSITEAGLKFLKEHGR